MKVYLNGEFIEHDQARISVFDRGFLFGDGLYEGLRAFSRDGKRRLIAPMAHVARLRAGLAAAGIIFDAESLMGITDRLLNAAGLSDAFVYWQVTRGTPDLSRGPARSRVDIKSLKPSVFAYAAPLPPIDFANAVPAVKRAALREDSRWHRGHVKAISLLGNILLAIDGAGDDAAPNQETLLHRIDSRGDLLTEGTYSNVMLVLPGERVGSDLLTRARIVTPSLDSSSILNGVTRHLLTHLLPSIEQRPVQVGELANAVEVLLIGTTTLVSAVTHVEARPVGSGAPGPIASAMNRRLLDAIAAGEDTHLPATPLDFGQPLAAATTH